MKQRNGRIFLSPSDVTGFLACEHLTTLESAGRDLIAAANDAGGRDNITVILFRLEEIAGAVGDGPPSEVTAQHGDGGETTSFDTFAASPCSSTSRR